MRCIYIKEDKEQCKANSMSDSNYCYLHNPDISEEEKRDAQIRGGRNRSLALTEPLNKITVNSSEDIFTLLDTTIQEVRDGELDPKIANTIGYLAGVMIKAYEVAKLERKVLDLEQALRS
jgi:hypothetical protein